jgi:hypothetical protein
MITTEPREHRAAIRKLRRERDQRYAITSAVVWEGDSPVDGAPIVAVVTNLTRPSINRKTGDMAQLYILRSDMRPIESVRTGADSATCGNCPLRPSSTTGVRCYVNAAKLAPLWASIPNLPRRSPREIGEYLAAVGLELREGSYGDPAMLPFDVRDALNPKRGTSYTHQWRESWADPRGAQLSMASVQTIAEKRAANAAGYRTYRVTSGDLEPDEILCPEITRNANCKACGLCAGNRVKAKNIVIRPI